MSAVLLPAAVPTKAVRRLAASVLIAEAFVVFFAVLVAIRLTPERTRAVVITGTVLAVAAIALSGLLRHRWAYLAGWLLQLALIATGLAKLTCCQPVAVSLVKVAWARRVPVAFHRLPV